MVIVLCALASAATVYFALWYSGYLEERACINGGGEWVRVRNMCVNR